ncbi:MAG: tripartite tricarboxylate transporter TctB family protein [Pseudomonadota bacterium]
MADGNRRERRAHAGGELVIPVAAVAFTLYYFSTIWNSPWTAQVGAFLVGGLLLAFCAVFFARVAIDYRAGEADLGVANLLSWDDWYCGRVGLLATTVGYVWFVEDLGFTLTTFLFLFLSMAILNRLRRLGTCFAVSGVMALGGWALFIWAFDTRFPSGWFEQTMRGLTG